MGSEYERVSEAIADVMFGSSQAGRPVYALADADTVVVELLEAAGDVPVWVKPNAGVPKMVGDEVQYEATPEIIASHVSRYVEQGARIVGGCCGSTPAHVAAIVAAVR